MSEAKQVPLPDLLRGVPRTKGLNIEEPNCTHHIPIGILAHEAADLIEQQAKELAEAQARVVVLSEAIRKHKKEIWDDFGINVGYDHDITLYEALAPTDTAAQKWIPVSERLPDTPIKLGELKLPNGEVFKPQENSYEVLVWRKGGSADITKLIRADSGATCWYLFNDEVTHWQPLPEPPKEKP